MNRILRMASGAAVMALVLAMTVMMTGCSTEGDDLTDRSGIGQSERSKPSSTRVTVRAAISDEADGTRSAVEDGTNPVTGKATHTLKFTTGDKLYVYKSGTGALKYVAGTLTVAPSGLSDDGKSATFTGDLVAYTEGGTVYNGYNFGADPLEGSNATLIHEGMTTQNNDYGFTTDGTIHFTHYSADDMKTLMKTCLIVKGDYTMGSGYTLRSSRPIINCALSGLTASTTYTLTLQSSGGGGTDSDINYFMTTDDTGAGTIAFIPDVFGSHEWNIAVTNGDIGFNGTISLGTMAFDPTKVYNVYRHWNTAGTYAGFSKTIDLSKLNNDVTVRNGMTLTGKLDDDSRHRVSIAAGATVTLDNMRISLYDLSSTFQFAGLTCLGDATIVLADGSSNKITLFYSTYPAIQAGPAGTTLTIRGGTAGTGSLNAKSDAGAYGIFGSAGIGGGKDMSVGNIRIEGGHITAIGGDQGAGIGCGEKDGASANASCGDITITGGTVSATGGNNGAGIGCGYDGDCGNISITGGVVTATGGNKGAGIGSGWDSKCGNISITAGVVTATGGNYGAGIGSGWKSECGNISITGGVVTATGGNYGAGIGSGESGSCKDIDIGGMATGTATGGDGALRDIGAGVGGSCGSVSVADGTINAIYACTLRLVYTYEGYVGVPIYNVSASQIRVSVGGKTYYAEGSSFTNNDIYTVKLPVMSNMTLTVTSPDTSYQMEEEQYSGQTITTYTHDFVGTLSNVTIDGEKDLGDVILVRQLP